MRFSQLNVSGTRKSDKGLIKSSIFDYYTNLYHEQAPSRPQLDDSVFPCLAQDKAASLELPCSEEEVLKAIQALGGDGPQAPTGFKLWYSAGAGIYMHGDVMDVVGDLMNNAHIDWRLKSTFLVLVHIKEVVIDVTNFRPISLMGSVNKILSEVLGTRLKVVMDELVSNHQSAFISG